MTDDPRQARDGLGDLAAALDRAGSRADRAARFVGRVFAETAVPTTAPKYFAVHPVILDGPEAEGGAPTETVVAGVTEYVAVLGGPIPVAGDDLVAVRVGDRWVARRPGAAPGGGGGPCNGSLLLAAIICVNGQGTHDAGASWDVRGDGSAGGATASGPLVGTFHADALGSASAAIPAAGPYWVRYTPGNGAPAQERVVTAPCGDATRATFNADPSRAITLNPVWSAYQDAASISHNCYVAGASVTVASQDGTYVISGTTDASGGWPAYLLAGGTYTITISHPAFQTLTWTGNLNTCTQSSFPLNVTGNNGWIYQGDGAHYGPAPASVTVVLGNDAALTPGARGTTWDCPVATNGFTFQEYDSASRMIDGKPVSVSVFIQKLFGGDKGCYARGSVSVNNGAATGSSTPGGAWASPNDGTAQGAGSLVAPMNWTFAGTASGTVIG